MTITTAPRNVLETILDWSLDRPIWQRDALRRVVAVGTPNEAAVAELLALCKKEHGAPDIELGPAALEAGHLPANPGSSTSIAIDSLTAVEAADVDIYRNNFKKCSDLVEAHDLSRGRDAAVPSPDEIMADIKTLADWSTALRAKQNSII
jgi:hypothetical protein